MESVLTSCCESTKQERVENKNNLVIRVYLQMKKASYQNIIVNTLCLKWGGPTTM